MKETDRGRGGMVKIDLLGEVLSRNALLPLVLCNNITDPVSYDELKTKLDDELATRNKRGLSKSQVNSQLRFLVRQNLLKTVEEKYQITPRGVQAATDLSPQAREGIHHSYTP